MGRRLIRSTYAMPYVETTKLGVHAYSSIKKDRNAGQKEENISGRESSTYLDQKVCLPFRQELRHRSFHAPFSMVNYNIREATEDDCEEIMQMLKELITFGKMADQMTVTADDLKRLGFGEKQYFQALVAELITDGSDGKQRPLVGMLVYDYTFDGFRGATARMINFYVDEEWRGKGIGSALWATLAQNALSMGCVSMFWEVWSWNTHANSYYKRRGSIDISGDEHRILFGLEKNNMKKLIADVLPCVGHIEDKSGSA